MNKGAVHMRIRNRRVTNRSAVVVEDSRQERRRELRAAARHVIDKRAINKRGIHRSVIYRRFMNECVINRRAR